MSSSGFDTAMSGTSETLWETLPLTPWAPVSGPLVVVGPHPDDETLGAGGLIFTCAQQHLPITVVAVTDGEAACPEVEDLEVIRRGELTRALQTLAGQAEVRLISLSIPDGQVCNHLSVLAEALRSVITSDATVVAPFELDGHTDHDAVGRVAQHIAQDYRATLAQYPIWAWHQGTPEMFASRKLGRFSLSATALEAKCQALSCYDSQLRERPGGAIVPPHVLNYFKRPYEVFLI